MNIEQINEAVYNRTYVEAGEGDDRDVGLILETPRPDSDTVEVAWNSGVRTVIAIADLRIEGQPTGPQLPGVNINGTDKQELFNQQVAIVEAIDAVERAFALATPHGRDYQTLPAGSYERARAEHLARWSKLEALKEEVTAYGLAIFHGE